MQLNAEIAVAVRSLAEDQSADYAPWPGSETLHGPGFDVWFGPPCYPDLTVVRRVRLDPDEVREAVPAARRLILARGRNNALWSIGGSAVPADLTKRLQSLGMQPDTDPILKAVLLEVEPADAPGDVEVRRATTRDDFRTFFRIQQAAFETDADVVAQGSRFIDEMYDAEVSAAHLATYLAHVDSEPIATARATFTDVGVVLNGGSTLQPARGRGAYRALVRARWDDAVARGTPLLTTLARPTSYPILKRLGFTDVCDVRMLIDRF